MAIPAELVAIPATEGDCFLECTERVAIPAELVAIPAKLVAIPATEGDCFLECIEPVAIPAEPVAIPAKQVAIPAKLVAIPATEGNCLPRHGQGVVNIGQHACGHGPNVINSSQEPSD